VEGAQTPTGIDALTEEMTAGDVKKVVVNGQLFILRDGKMYDAQGQLVQTY